MKKLLLGLITIFAFGTMNVHATMNDLSVETFINLESPTEFFQEDTFKISPNPSKNKLNIKLPKSSDDMILEVFDVLGKRIHKGTITNLESSVDVSRWKTGVYLVKVSNEEGSQTKRFIKQ